MTFRLWNDRATDADLCGSSFSKPSTRSFEVLPGNTVGNVLHTFLDDLERDHADDLAATVKHRTAGIAGVDRGAELIVRHFVHFGLRAERASGNGVLQLLAFEGAGQPIMVMFVPLSNS